MNSVPNQRVEFLVNTDLAADSRGSVRQISSQSFTLICDIDRGLWVQKLTSGMTARLSEVEIQLLRRSADISAPVEIEIRSVGDASRPTQTVLGQGSTAATIPADRTARLANRAT
jgi:hypothetical protein